jgi:arylsulfatase A-like enzyme
MSRERKPNIVFVLTDDQGYPDLGCCGNPWLKTPCIDAFAGQAVRFQDFHVAPLCAPTRGALMTGLRPARNGVWATCWGRSILNPDNKILPELLQQAGYRTGMFGKWHLGDNVPNRPQDRGFKSVVAHKGGGVGQTPDFWGNNYFDDTYFCNGEPTAYKGYCTDVWFSQAERFIRAHRDEPFFCYLATNAPHQPYLVPDFYRKPYEGIPEIPNPDFYGMIANIDENFGRLRATLQELGLEDDTILIFMTDNGSSGAALLDEDGYPIRGYNAGLRGKKGSYYEGGHKVPFFLRWKNGGLENRDVREMCLHVDILPTLLSLCGVPLAQPCDGQDLSPLARGDREQLPQARYEFIQLRQSTEPPRKWSGCVMNRQWRLIDGCELYDIQHDPGQQQDVAADHPQVVERMRAAFEEYWKKIAPGIDEYSPIWLGDARENPAELNAMDVMGDVDWNQAQIAAAKTTTGNWRVRITRPGLYRFCLRRWPTEFPLAINADCGQEEARKLAPYTQEWGRTGTVEARQARLRLFGNTLVQPVDASQPETVLEQRIERTGETTLVAEFLDDQGRFLTGSYYVSVLWMGPA